MAFQLIKRSMAVRTLAAPSRITTRGYALNDTINKKEKADEDIYVKKHEAEQLAKLKEALEKIKSETSTLEKKIEDIEKK